jgi:hypothetical protein
MVNCADLVLVDGYALPVAVRLYGEHVARQEASSLHA